MKLYSYFVVAKHSTTELLKESFEVKDIDDQKYVVFGKDNVKNLAKITTDKFSFIEYQGANGYRMCSLIDYKDEEVKAILLAQIVPQRNTEMRDLMLKAENLASYTQRYICNPIVCI